MAVTVLTAQRFSDSACHMWVSIVSKPLLWPHACPVLGQHEFADRVVLLWMGRLPLLLSLFLVTELVRVREADTAEPRAVDLKLSEGT